MATVTPDVTFESVKEDIIRVFEQLQQKLDERKQVLMGQLLAIKEGVERSAEMTEMREKNAKKLVSLPDNVPESERKRIEYILTEQMKEAEARRMVDKFNMVKISCYNTENLEECIAKISLVEDIPAYVSKLSPVIKCGASGSGHGKFNAPRGVCIDAITNNVYVIDSGNMRIQVLNKSGEYVNAIGWITGLWGVAVTDQFVYVTDESQHRIVQFDRDGKFIRTEGSYESAAPLKFNCPRGIAAYNNKLYVCDCVNHTIKVVDTFLKYIEEFTSDELILPTDIHITASAIHVLPQDGNIVHLFANPGYAPIRVVKLTGQEYNMSVHYFFTVDQLGNYLVSAEKEDHIRVFDNTGALRHIIGEGHMECPYGIAVDSNSNIICITGEINNRFQTY